MRLVLLILPVLLGCLDQAPEPTPDASADAVVAPQVIDTVPAGPRGCIPVRDVPCKACEAYGGLLSSGDQEPDGHPHCRMNNSLTCGQDYDQVCK